MKLNLKNYKILKITKYFQINKLFLLINGMNQSSLDWRLVEQELKSIGFKYYKTSNKATSKALRSSIYTNARLLLNGSSFLLKPNRDEYFFKQSILNAFSSLDFEPLVIKLNNKMYSIISLEVTRSLEYKATQLLFYQFSLTYLKAYFVVSK